MPCAFQCVSAQANVKGNCSRFTCSSTVDDTACGNKGTHLRLSGSSGKNERWLPSASTPRFTESNSTKTHSGLFFSDCSECGSPPSGHIYPLRTPSAPFIKPASTHKFCVRSTRAPSHIYNSFSMPRKSSAFIFVGSIFSPFSVLGVPCLACNTAIGFPVRLDSCSNNKLLTRFAPLSPETRSCRPSMSKGASSNFCNSFRPAAVCCNKLRFLRASHACCAAVHVQSASPRVTLGNSTASFRYSSRRSMGTSSLSSAYRCTCRSSTTSFNSFRMLIATFTNFSVLHASGGLSSARNGLFCAFPLYDPSLYKGSSHTGVACFGSPARTTPFAPKNSSLPSLLNLSPNVSRTLNSIFPNICRPTMLISSNTKMRACVKRVFIRKQRPSWRFFHGPQYLAAGTPNKRCSVEAPNFNWKEAHPVGAASRHEFRTLSSSAFSSSRSFFSSCSNLASVFAGTVPNALKRSSVNFKVSFSSSLAMPPNSTLRWTPSRTRSIVFFNCSASFFFSRFEPATSS